MALEVCDTTWRFCLLKCSVSLLDVWFGLCILFIFTFKPLSFITVHIPGPCEMSCSLLVAALYYLGLNMTTVRRLTVKEYSGKSV